MSKKRISATDLLDRLQSDPKYRQIQEEKEDERKIQEIISRDLQRALIEDLRSIGLDVSTVWNLVNMKQPYPKAIPILMRHLQMNYPDTIKEGIARSLTVKEAKGIAGSLVVDCIKELEDSMFPKTKWALANALTVVADVSNMQGIEEIISNPREVIAHDRLIAAMKKLRKESHKKKP